MINKDNANDKITRLVVLFTYCIFQLNNSWNLNFETVNEENFIKIYLIFN